MKNMGWFIYSRNMIILTIKHTSGGRKFAVVEVLSPNSKSVPDRVFMSVFRGRCGMVKLSPGFQSNYLIH